MSSDESGDFRKRLRGIPRIDEDPVEWDGQHQPPVVRRAAPVARPQPGPQPRRQSTGHEPAARQPVERGAVPDQPYGQDPRVEAYFDDGGAEAAGDGEQWPVGARRRRRWPLVLMALLLIAGLVVIIPLYRARQVFNNVERVPVASALVDAPIEGVNILLVGTDSREGIDGSTENSGLIIGRDVDEAPITGERSDTIMILRLQEDGSAKFLSLPRDLWLPINGGNPQRINTAFGGGPEALINTIQLELGVPLSHYVQVDLVGFMGLVDAVGGVDVTIENPAFDTRSGLDLPTAGTVTLDSAQALAYVRSRFYTERIDGAEVVDGTSDLGRVQRQQAFMRALFSTVAEQRNPQVLNSMGTAMSEAVVIDDATSMSDAFEIANTLRTTTPESVVLPTRPASIGGRSVLELTDEAPAVLAQFGAG